MPNVEEMPDVQDNLIIERLAHEFLLSDRLLFSVFSFATNHLIISISFYIFMCLSLSSRERLGLIQFQEVSLYDPFSPADF